MSDSVTKYFENADTTIPSIKTDGVVNDVVYKYKERSSKGIEHYGTTLEDSKEDTVAFLTHLQEEMMDGTLYIEKLLKLLRNANENAT